MQKLKRTQVKKIRDLLQLQQGNRCALCNCDFSEMTLKNRKRVAKFTPALDHCHQQGHVRAVLCTNCNGREGEIFNRATRCKRDGTALEWLRRLADYWEKHAEPQTAYIHPDHKSEEEKRIAKNTKARNKRAAAKAKAMLAGR